MTLADIKQMESIGSLTYHHSATERGYIRKNEGIRVGKYSGKFGEGYIVKYPNCQYHISNRYYRIEYYLYK